MSNNLPSFPLSCGSLSAEDNIVWVLWPLLRIHGKGFSTCKDHQNILAESRSEAYSTESLHLGPWLLKNLKTLCSYNTEQLSYALVVHLSAIHACSHNSSIKFVFVTLSVIFVFCLPNVQPFERCVGPQKVAIPLIPNKPLMQIRSSQIITSLICKPCTYYL